MDTDSPASDDGRPKGCNDILLSPGDRAVDFCKSLDGSFGSRKKTNGSGSDTGSRAELEVTSLDLDSHCVYLDRVPGTLGWELPETW